METGKNKSTIISDGEDRIKPQLFQIKMTILASLHLRDLNRCLQLFFVFAKDRAFSTVCLTAKVPNVSQRMRISEAKMQSHKTLLDGCCRASWLSARQVPPSDKMPTCFTLTDIFAGSGSRAGKTLPHRSAGYTQVTLILMPPIYFLGNQNSQKEHNNTI